MTAELKVSVTIYTMKELVCIQINSNIQTNMREKKNRKNQLCCFISIPTAFEKHLFGIANFLYVKHFDKLYLATRINFNIYIVVLVSLIS